MLLAGVGFLLPYNSFITDVDYLHHKYPGRSPAAAAYPSHPKLGESSALLPGELDPPPPSITCLSAGTSIVFDMSLTYILVALVAVILNNALVELLSLHTRISVGEWGSPQPPAAPAPCCPTTTRFCLPPAGYLFALGPLLFVSICDVWLELFTRRQAYAINLVAVGVVAFGCTGMWTAAGAGASPALWIGVGKHPHPQEPWSAGTTSCSDPYKLTPLSLLHLCPGTAGLDGATRTKPCISPQHHDGFAIWATMVTSHAPAPGGHSWWEQPWWGTQGGQ